MIGTVGFIGIGTIGAPMARSVMRGGYRLVVHDLNQAAVQRIVAEGAGAAESPAALARQADMVVTMLPDAPDLRQVVSGPNGILEGMKDGLVLVDMSTMDPTVTVEVAGEIAARGGAMLDCPVAKTVEDAERGELTLMAGGDPEAFERVRPVLATMGSMIIYCGRLGNGAKSKLINNLIAQGIMVLMSEALALGVKSGLTLDRIVEVIANTHAANNQLLHVQPYKAFSGNFKAGFMTALAAKDQRLIMGLAESLGVDLPMGRVMRDAFQAAIAAGYAHDDCCSVIRVREQAAGVEVRLQDSPGR
jgi:4-hydroxybutyrate dehydrogenase/sulfolactaldehyde 3-reductase